jgi:hypothetical protein
MRHTPSNSNDRSLLGVWPSKEYPLVNAKRQSVCNVRRLLDGEVLLCFSDVSRLSIRVNPARNLANQDFLLQKLFLTHLIQKCRVKLLHQRGQPFRAQVCTHPGPKHKFGVCIDQN